MPVRNRAWPDHARPTRRRDGQCGTPEAGGIASLDPSACLVWRGDNEERIPLRCIVVDASRVIEGNVDHRRIAFRHRPKR